MHFRRAQPVLWALCWRDAICDPQAKDNEEQSAVFPEREAQGHLPADDIFFAATIIRATAAHKVPDGLGPGGAGDTALFLDLDLSILGPSHVYHRYETGIRAEYAFVAEAAFRAGLGAIPKAFLARERLCLTDFAHAEWDLRARENLKRAIAALEAPA